MESNEQSHHSGMGNPFRNSTSDGDDVYQGEDENDETDNQSEIVVSSKTKLGNTPKDSYYSSKVPENSGKGKEASMQDESYDSENEEDEEEEGEVILFVS